MRKLLTLLALVEPMTLAVLLLNVLVLHIPVVAHVLGPIHGTCYVGVIVVAMLLEGQPVRARLLSLVPGVGGLLTDRFARRHPRPDHNRRPERTSS